MTKLIKKRPNKLFHGIPEDYRVWACLYCPREFADKYNLPEHTPMIYPEFFTKYDYLEHLRKIHPIIYKHDRTN